MMVHACLALLESYHWQFFIWIFFTLTICCSTSFRIEQQVVELSKNLLKPTLQTQETNLNIREMKLTFD